MSNRPVSRALVSVSDKRGIVEFCRGLAAIGVEILSTGGTASKLRDNDIKVIEVSEYTEFPEMMDGRVKTLHPRIHGGILGRRGVDDEVMKEHGIGPIDMVVVNLYPFEKTVADPDCTLDRAIENIDIGGPGMLRAAAKNHRDVVALVDPGDYDRVLAGLQQNSACVDATERFRLALKTFSHTAAYDSAIAAYLSTHTGDDEDARFPPSLHLQFDRKQAMRYGENPHQDAAFYVERDRIPGIATARQLQGKALSYNNIADTDAALECVRQFDGGPACVIVKHANPCGVAVASTLGEAYERAFSTDPESAFGGIIAFNGPLDGETASRIVERQFVEVIIAPTVSAEAVAAVAARENVRLLECGDLGGGDHYLDFKKVRGGLLVQTADELLNERFEVVTRQAPSSDQQADLLFAWKVAKFVKSNAIVYARDGMTVGVGAGQMSRVNSARIAAIKAEHAGLEVAGSVMASDAFFPFRDGLDNAAEAGIRAVIQPGGSMRDDEVIAAADEHGIAMVFSGTRHFRH